MSRGKLNFELNDKRRALLEALRRGNGAKVASIQPIPRRPEGETAPLSFSQQRLWFLDQFEPGSSAYNIPAALRLKGLISISALEYSFNEIVRRHEALRT